MSSGGWNYRMVRLNGMVGIYEAYYDSHGRVRAITEEPVDVLFSEEEDEPVIEALRRCLSWMTLALDKPVLDYDKIPEDGALPWGEAPVDKTTEPLCDECIVAMRSDDIPVEDEAYSVGEMSCAVCGKETHKEARW